MPHCVGVSFKRVAKSYWFDPSGLRLKENDRVIVETSRGAELGRVRVGPRDVAESDIQAPLKRVVRVAIDEDFDQEKRNKEKARAALDLCQQHINSLNLPMKLLQAEYSFEGSQVTIYFTAEARVDFRDLVRDVAAGLRCKVQLHQVGARDQARMIGGVGPCGLTLCCATFLTEFAPISMKMAKDQSLFLNPVKFSGVCGKLMCCLRYEHEPNSGTTKRLPQIGEIVMSPSGQGKVLDLNLQTEMAVVQILDGLEELEFPAAELKIEKVGRCTDCRGCSVDQLSADEDDAVRVDNESRRAAEHVARERDLDGDTEFSDDEEP
jgi:cell fate regulator YaaT (PSP1 superfamily)